MAQPDPDRVARDVASINAWATVHQMGNDADELAELCEVLEPSPHALPKLSTDPRERQLQLLTLLLFERERSRRLLALLAS